MSTEFALLLISKNVYSYLSSCRSIYYRKTLLNEISVSWKKFDNFLECKYHRIRNPCIWEAICSPFRLTIHLLMLECLQFIVGNAQCLSNVTSHLEHRSRCINRCSLLADAAKLRKLSKQTQVLHERGNPKQVLAINNI